MIYTTYTIKAMKLAFYKHNGQVDKGGTPYIFHSMHLAEQMDTEYEICAALLHDVVEDTSMSIGDLRSDHFPSEVIDAVECLTRRKKENYWDYLARVKGNKIATKVKIADLRHNLEESRLLDVEFVSVDDRKELIRRTGKYRRALYLLGA